MYQVDLNCDLGESFGAYKIGMDEKIIPLISSANIACGFHASDPLVMEKTTALATANGIGMGAHPGFPDLQGFGRREMKLSSAEVKALIIYQIGALSAFVKAKGKTLQHVKPHGALYNMAGKDEKLAMAICEGIRAVDENLIVLGQSGSRMEAAANSLGLPFAREVFADRAYEEDGSLRYGWENISQPASLSYHMENMTAYKEMFSILSDNGLSSHDTNTCGLKNHCWFQTMP